MLVVEDIIFWYTIPESVDMKLDSFTRPGKHERPTCLGFHSKGVSSIGPRQQTACARYSSEILIYGTPSHPPRARSGSFTFCPVAAVQIADTSTMSMTAEVFSLRSRCVLFFQKEAMCWGGRGGTRRDIEGPDFVIPRTLCPVLGTAFCAYVRVGSIRTAVA